MNLRFCLILSVILGVGGRLLAQPADPPRPQTVAPGAERPLELSTPTTAPAEAGEARPRRVPKKKLEAGELPALADASRGNSSRGDADVDVTLTFIGPPDVGYCASVVPVLYFHLSAPVSYPVQMTVSQESTPGPIARREWPGGLAAGFHSIDIARSGAALQPGVTYEAVVAIVQDPRHRSRDVVAGGLIALKQLPAGGLAQYAAMDPFERVGAYLRAGLVYDAIDELLGTSTAFPNDPIAAEARAWVIRSLQLVESTAADTRSR